MVDENFRTLGLFLFPFTLIVFPVVGTAFLEWIGRQLDKLPEVIAKMEAQEALEAAKKAAQNNKPKAA